MGGCCGKKKKKEGEEDDDEVLSIIGYMMAGGVFYAFIFMIVCFFGVYLSGCNIAAREATKFLERFQEKVRLNEINGITMEDLEDALGGRRIFWMGPEYEATKKRKLSVETLKVATPDTIGPEEIDIPILTAALREAEMVGTATLRMPGDPKYGAKVVKKATDKLMQAKKVQAKSGIARRGSGIARDAAEDVEGIPDPNYPANKPKTRDQMEGRSDQGGQIDTDGLGDDNSDEDFAAKLFEDEIKAAEAANDANLVRMVLLASIKHIDSYKVDKKLMDDNGKITDPVRAINLICEAKGILHSFHSASAAFSRRIVKWSHSMPFYRLMEYGWQPSIAHTDFAGILNANALYSFTVGFPQLAFSLSFSQYTAVRTPFPCEYDMSTKCTVLEDFSRPNVSSLIVLSSFAIGILSLVLSLVNMVIDFPAQIFAIAEKEEEALHFTLQAEHATKTWEDKLAVEVQENVKMMLKMSTQFENNSIPGMEAPGLVIEDVMKLERRAMEKRVAYITHYLTMSEDEKKIRSDLRKGKRDKKKKGEEEPEAADMAGEQDQVQGEEPVPPAPPMRQPSAPPIPPQRLPAPPEATPDLTPRIPDESDAALSVEGAAPAAP